MKNFIDFIADASKNEALTTEMETKLNNSNIIEMSKWFQEKGYNVNNNDCEKLMHNKDGINLQKAGFMY